MYSCLLKIQITANGLRITHGARTPEWTFSLSGAKLREWKELQTPARLTFLSVTTEEKPFSRAAMMRCLIWIIYLMTQPHLRISCISSSNSSFPSCCDLYWTCHMPVPHGMKKLFLKVVSMVQWWPRDQQSHRSQKCKHRGAISHPMRISHSKDSLDHRIHVDKVCQTARKTISSASNHFFFHSKYSYYFNIPSAVTRKGGLSTGTGRSTAQSVLNHTWGKPWNSRAGNRLSWKCSGKSHLGWAAPEFGL